jgi:hypothetical protein
VASAPAALSWLELAPSGTLAGAGLPPEMQVLLCCARTTLDADTAAHLRGLLQTDLDWGTLLHTAHWHGILPLLAWHVPTTFPELVPPAIEAQLQGYFHAHTLYNRWRTEAFVHIIHQLAAHDIIAVPYKGPAVAATLYGDMALRPFQDFDLLVRPQDAMRAADLLLAQGYRLCNPRDGNRAAADVSTRKDYRLESPDGRILVELHWGIAGRQYFLRLDPGRFWARLQTITLAGTPVSSFPPETLLLLLSVHAAKHLWCRLIWLCDLAELLRVHQHLAWDEVLVEARRVGVQRLLGVSLRLAQDLLGAAVPGVVGQALQADPAVAGLAAQVRTWLCTEAPSPRFASQHPWFYLRLRERGRDKAPYLLQHLRRAVRPTALDRAWLPLPALLAPLYYLLRPLRVTARYGRQAWKHLARRWGGR